MHIALLGAANSIHFQRWAWALVARGHKLYIISQHRCNLKLLPSQAEIIWLPYSGSVAYFTNALKLKNVLKQVQPDLLNVHYASGYGTTAALCGFQPTLLSVWGSDVFDFPYENKLKAMLLRWNIRRAIAIASTSHVMADQVRRLTPERKRISITPFGVDMEHFFPHASKVKSNILTIGIVKTLAPKYGVDVLLRAFALLVLDTEFSISGQSCQLIVVGDGPQRLELEQLALSLKIGHLVNFVGYVSHENVPVWLNKLDIYVAPSVLDSESFGVAVLEASACGIPVIVSDAGGLPEVVIDGQTGFIVPRGNINQLKIAMKKLIMNSELRAQFGINGYNHIKSNYEWSYCVDLMEQAYINAVMQC